MLLLVDTVIAGLVGLFVSEWAARRGLGLLGVVLVTCLSFAIVLIPIVLLGDWFGSS